jgi:hypothetical protein
MSVGINMVLLRRCSFVEEVAVDIIQYLSLVATRQASTLMCLDKISHYRLATPWISAIVIMQVLLSCFWEFAAVFLQLVTTYAKFALSSETVVPAYVKMFLKAAHLHDQLYFS